MIKLMKNTQDPHRPKIVTDSAVTAETDDLNTDEAVASAQEVAEPAKDEQTETDANDLNIDSSDTGLNHDKDDDLSLN